MQVTGKLARMGARLAKLGLRERDLEARIANVEARPNADPLILRRLKREKQRLSVEVYCYEATLRADARRLSA